jgi:hypothetical protein
MLEKKSKFKNGFLDFVNFSHKIFETVLFLFLAVLYVPVFLFLNAMSWGDEKKITKKEAVKL